MVIEVKGRIRMTVPFPAWASGSEGCHSFTDRKRTSSRNESKGERLWLNSGGYVDLEVPVGPSS